MPQKKPLSDAELAAFEAGQDFEALLVQSAREMGAGKTRKVYTPVVAARENAGLSQARFAELLGVSVRTLQQWEQGRREPTGAAKTLVAIAVKMPEALKAVDPSFKAPAARVASARAVAVMRSAVEAANNAFEAVQRAADESTVAVNSAKKTPQRSRSHGRAVTKHI
ncbi:helix-turn-helix domain-containing protein [Variovorax paradoxus]|nr:helix-turn-helix domain-containing protein [Variovorax paradoxus]MBT2305034.1 helix-turn-helix domain-containing protein [Variovorax paradoxus]